MFHRMPYLLTLQLMRFTFDLTTLNRIKINDRFTFPLDRWDLSEFITDPPPGDPQPTDDEGDESYGEEDCYPETENEYDQLTDGPHADTSTNIECMTNGVRRTANSVGDEFEEMDTANGDSGVNSTITDRFVPVLFVLIQTWVYFVVIQLCSTTYDFLRRCMSSDFDHQWCYGLYANQ